MAKKKRQRDIEKIYDAKSLAAKLRRLADSVEKGTRFQIQIAGERISVPAKAEFSLEHERGEGEEEIEFQIRWSIG